MKKIRSLALAGLFALSAAPCSALTLTENFSANPLTNGWQVFGDTNLFQWDATNQTLNVTWNSSQTNSYFCHPLGTTLTKADGFAVDFDIQLNDITWTGYPVLAVGLFNFAEATNTGFSRPAANTPDLFEFDYYPDSGDRYADPNVAATLTDMTVSDTNMTDFYFIYDNLPLTPGATYHVTLTHTAGADAIAATILTNGQVYTTMPNAFAAPVVDFHLDTVSVNSYEDDYDPLLAHGAVDNFVVTLPPPVRNLTGVFSNGLWQVQFGTYTNWSYTLERSTNLVSWSDASAATGGSGSALTLSDTGAPPDRAFYRVRAVQP